MIRCEANVDQFAAPRQLPAITRCVVACAFNAHSDGIAITAQSDLIATVPNRCLYRAPPAGLVQLIKDEATRLRTTR